MRNPTHPAHGLFVPLPSGQEATQHPVENHQNEKQLLPGCCEAAKELNNAASLIVAWF